MIVRMKCYQYAGSASPYVPVDKQSQPHLSRRGYGFRCSTVHVKLPPMVIVVLCVIVGIYIDCGQNSHHSLDVTTRNYMEWKERGGNIT